VKIDFTANRITTDFAGSARVGDWVEAHVDVHKVGGRMAFANCYIVRDGERIVHASGVFARSGDRPAGALSAMLIPPQRSWGGVREADGGVMSHER
jgi:hypothetical protein